MILKKLLIISNYAPPAISGAPLMMYNLLKYFPENSFRILTSYSGIDRRADKSRWLRAKYFFFDRPSLVAVPQKENSPFQKLKSSLRKFPITNFLGQIFLFFYLPLKIISLGKKTLKEESIELLLCYSDYGPALFSTYLLHKITKKPFFLYFYDLYYGNKLPLFYRALAFFLEPKLFQHAEKVFVMSDILREYYQKKYGREVFLIRNSIPIEKSKLEAPFGHSEPYKIVFTGTIYWPQLDAVKNLIKAVEDIQNPKVQLFLYTPHDKDYLKRQGIVESKKVIFATGSSERMPEIQKSADILFIPLGFRTKYPLLINTSSPGKTGEYLLSGRPILIHAPQNSYLTQYAKKHNFALVVDEENIKKLKEAVTELITDKELVKELTINARQTALQNHDAAKNSRFFQKFFIK